MFFKNLIVTGRMLGWGDITPKRGSFGKEVTGGAIYVV
jgi:hypothetical protein